MFRKPREPMGRGKEPLSITAGKPPGLRTGGGAGIPAEYSLLSGLWSRQLLRSLTESFQSPDARGTTSPSVYR